MASWISDVGCRWLPSTVSSSQPAAIAINEALVNHPSTDHEPTIDDEGSVTMVHQLVGPPLLAAASSRGWSLEEQVGRLGEGDPVRPSPTQRPSGHGKGIAWR